MQMGNHKSHGGKNLLQQLDFVKKNTNSAIRYLVCQFFHDYITPSQVKG